MEEPDLLPLTALAWTSSQNTCSKEYTVIEVTVEGTPAIFVKGFGQKSGYYLCSTSSVTAESSAGNVITDIQILNERSLLPAGFSYIGEFLEPKTSVSKKKRICVKLSPITAADTAVFDIKLCGKSKQILHSYVRVGEVGGLYLWCKKGKISVPKPLPKPRNLSMEMRGLSLDSTNQANTKVAAESVPSQPPGRPSLERTFSLHESSNVYGISAMDGVPFTLHPKFENKNLDTNVLSTFSPDLHIKSLTDIENEYSYAFMVERSAAARLPHRVG
uniref:Multivesicular body subunit 12A n=1 Tax=Geotrypetes seraphini TaxID=260995 RepID=A0A6P8N969_GEOSA|nr:multivesicular body subunit 12A [Geotrypetes seraphini]XP_033772157.1 multivesicular body subunit 12A [Geotrypetes seraphini]XP_033772158.1 multivesicular body subunit 12A [Geotrypetes seraphini]